jgi:acid phosphatase (class A)
MMFFFRFALCLTCLSVAASAAAVGYLSEDEIDVVSALGPPPKINSAVARNDRAVSEGWQLRRTPEDCERILREAHVNLQSLFAGPGGLITDAEANRLSPFIMKVKQDGAYYSELEKMHWRRLRPFAQYPSIRLCPEMDSPGDFSFPSGHATDSRLFALVLAEIYPLRRTALIAHADQIAEDRVIAGAHFSTDVEAGKKLGDLLFSALMSHDSFREDLRKQK